MPPDDVSPNPHPPGRAVFNFDGRSYTLPATTIGDRKAFHAWCNSQAIAEVSITEVLVGTDGYTAEMYDFAYDRMMAKVGSGWWSPGAPGYREKLVSGEGLSYLCWVSMARPDKKIKLEQVRAVVQTQEGFDLLWAKFREANANPTVAPAE